MIEESRMPRLAMVALLKHQLWPMNSDPVAFTNSADHIADA